MKIENNNGTEEKSETAFIETKEQHSSASPDVTITVSPKCEMSPSPQNSPQPPPIDVRQSINEDNFRNRNNSSFSQIDAEAFEAFKTLGSCRTLDLKTLEDYRMLLERRTLQVQSRTDPDIALDYHGRVRSYPHDQLTAMYLSNPNSSADQEPATLATEVSANRKIDQCSPDVIIQKSQ